MKMRFKHLLLEGTGSSALVGLGKKRMRIKHILLEGSGGSKLMGLGKEG